MVKQDNFFFRRANFIFVPVNNCLSDLQANRNTIASFSSVPNIIFTTRKRSLRRLCFYRCLSVHRGVCMVTGGACMVAGGMHGCQGACMVAGGHVWQRGGMRGERGNVWQRGGMHCKEGACIAKGDMHGKGGPFVAKGGHAWQRGGMRGKRGACVGYDEIRSMSGQYASYWNAFLFGKTSPFFLSIKYY